MDPLDRAFQSERAWIARAEDVRDVLDRMADYRDDARAAERVGNTKAKLRVSDLLELAEDRVAELKAEAMRARRPRPATDERSASRSDSRPPVQATTDDTGAAELRAARAELAATKAAHRTEVSAREAAERREREAAALREGERAVERDRREDAEREAQARRERIAERSRAADAAARRASMAEQARPQASAHGVPGPAHAMPVPEARMANPNAQSAAHDAPVASADPATSGVAKAIGLRAPARLPGRAADLAGGPDRPSALDVRAESTDEPPAFTGAQLAALRRSTGLAQAEFAQKLGVTQGTVSKAEGNPRAALGPALRVAMAGWHRNSRG
jgi:DNA-binding transcriptional regulator YiaG